MSFLSKIFKFIKKDNSSTVEQSAGGDISRYPSSFYEKHIGDVCIPKAGIIAVATGLGKGDLVNVFRESGLSRLPVYDGTLDRPVGLIHLKDFALDYGFDATKGKRFSIKRLLRPLLFVPPSMAVAILLQKMQSERLHMALVVDEYGGVDGLVTIEDLIEQVVGEIEDEHDPDEGEIWQKESAGVFNALAHAPLEEFEKAIGASLSENMDDEIDTLGGLVFALAGRVPVRGEVISHPDGHEFEILDADLRRIKKLRMFPNGRKAP